MSELDEVTMDSSYNIDDQIRPPISDQRSLRFHVEIALTRYFQHIEDEPVRNLHQMVMAEVEAPLLRAVMQRAGNNQSKASIMLGLNRGTLRPKLKQYGLLKQD